MANMFGKPETSGLCQGCKTKYRRVAKLRKAYGVTPEWFDAKLEEQGGGCAFCGKKLESENNRFRSLCVDHDHKTGKARGILCRRCNATFERVDTVPGWIEKAMAYLKHYAAA